VTFNGFIEGLLDSMSPFPGRNSVVVMDNASIHKSEELRAMIEARLVLSRPRDMILLMYIDAVE